MSQPIDHPDPSTELLEVRQELAELAAKGAAAGNHMLDYERRQTLAALAAALVAQLRDCWTTPKPLAAALVAEFGITTDAASSPANAVAPNRLADGLAELWTEPTWCNPPYSDILPWVQHALRSPAPATLLLPARTASPAFRLLVVSPRVTWWTFRGRVKFDPPEGIQASSPRHDSLLVHVHRHRGIGYAGIRDSKTADVLERGNR